MRTTLDIDEDVLAAAKELARSDGRTAGKVISELARKGLTSTRRTENATVKHGFELLPPSDAVISVELIDRLLEEEG